MPFVVRQVHALSHLLQQEDAELARHLRSHGAALDGLTFPCVRACVARNVEHVCEYFDALALSQSL